MNNIVVISPGISTNNVFIRLSSPGYHSKIIDWAERVVNNGGGYPSSNTLSAFDVFYRSLLSYGLDTKIKAMNCYAPDDIIAATTPLISDFGNGLWTNYGFTASYDLNVNGLKGGVNKYLSTGVKTENFSFGNFGVTLYASEITKSGYGEYLDLGDAELPGGVGSFQISLYNPVVVGSLFDWPLGTAIAGRITFSMPSSSGYFCCVRTGNDLLSVYYANNNTPHGLAKYNTYNFTTEYSSDRSIIVHARNRNDLVVDSFSPNRIGFVAFHTSMSKEDSENLYNCVQTLRDQISNNSAPQVTDGQSSIVEIFSNNRFIMPMSGLKMWLKPESLSSYSHGESIVTWLDSSGLNNHATSFIGAQPTYMTSSINGYGAVNFSAPDNQYFTYPDIISDISEAELFLVIKTNLYPPSFADYTGIYSFGAFSAIRSHYSWTDGIIYDNFCSTERKTTGTPPISLSLWHLYNVNSATNEWTSRINGIIHFTTSSNSVSNNPTYRYIGRSLSNSGFNYYLNGQIAEVLFYDRVLSSDERDQIENYFSEKFNLMIS